MANIASAKKRILVTARKEKENQMLTSKLKTMLKKFDEAVKSNNIQQAENLLPETESFIDSLRLKGILHSNNADRKKATLAKKIDVLKKASAQAPAAAEEKKAE